MSTFYFNCIKWVIIERTFCSLLKIQALSASWCSRNSLCTLYSYQQATHCTYFLNLRWYLGYVTSDAMKKQPWKSLDGFSKMSHSCVYFFLKTGNFFVLHNICHSNLASTFTQTAVEWTLCNSLLINVTIQIWTHTCSATSIGWTINMLIWLQEEILYVFYIQQLLQLF